MKNYRYTILSFNFDGYEIIREVNEPLDDVEYVYVTNEKNATSNTWKVIYDPYYNTIENSFDKVVEFRRRALDYCSTGICCRIDGSISIYGNAFDKTIEEFNKRNYDISFILHPWFNTIEEEYRVWEKYRGMSHNEVQKVLEFFQENSYNINLNNVYTLGILIQRNNELCRNINKKQYEVLSEIKDYCGVNNFNRCDQAVFTYTLDKYFNSVNVLPLHYTIIERKGISQLFHHRNDKEALYNKQASFNRCYYLFGKKLFKVFNGDKWIGTLSNNEIYEKSVKILLKTPDNVYNTYFLENSLPNIKDSYRDWLSNEDVITIGSSKIEDYQYNDINNKHHYTMEWYYNKLLPIIINELHIPYNDSDFVKIFKNGTYYLRPKEEISLEVYCPSYLNDGGEYVQVFYNMDCVHNENSNMIFMCDELYKNNFVPAANDDFHKLFKYCHLPVKIVNPFIETRNVLLIIGNSHTIPFIPILVKYFYKVIVIDNRLNNFYFDFLYAFEDITHILILASYDTNKNRLLNTTCSN